MGNMETSESTLEFRVADEIFPRFLGVEDRNLRQIEKRFKSRFTARNGRIVVTGPVDEHEQIKRIFTDLEALFKERRTIDKQDVDTILMLAGSAADNKPQDKTINGSVVLETSRGSVSPKSQQQANYVKLMAKQPVVFAIGPAGTGKTYLAVASAVDQFQRRVVEKIILVRPVVETGETLGFLPGDILEKVNPYFRPLYDALEDMMTRDRVRRFIDRGLIEVAPLAYMRGRTLSNAVVILDEAQNTTSGQMKMFLTRLGKDSRAVLTGDLTQIDLSDPRESGLFEAKKLLQGIDGIGFIEFSEEDVIRHRLVADILRAYHGEGNDNQGG